MNETRQKRIEQAARKYADSLADGQYYGDSPITRARLHAFKKGAEFILQNQWVSLDEALPSKKDGEHSCSVDVFVRNEYGGCTSAWYDYASKNWHLSYGVNADENDLIHSRITHWMLIPELL